MKPLRKVVGDMLRLFIPKGEWDTVWRQADELGRVKSNMQPLMLELCKRIERLEDEILTQSPKT